MPFEHFGYLGKQAVEIEKEIYCSNKDIFDYAVGLNSYLHQIGSRLTINTSNNQQLFVAASFIRILYGYQSTILLTQKGLISDAKAILRVVLETLFILKAVSDDSEFVIKYAQSNDAKRLKLMNAIQQNDHNVFKGFIEQNTEDKIAKLKKYINDNEIKEYKTIELAQKAGLMDAYEYAYRILSNEVHISPSVISQYFILNENGAIIRLQYIPQTNDINQIIGTLIYVVTVSIECMAKTFKLDVYEKLDELQKKLLELKDLQN